jgi:NAD(P)-dependent dehydrogenase (short-subunit alcohol dehydrogenase family)
VNDKAVVVTGAAGGIGRALCEAFRSAGFYVIGLDVAAVGDWADAGVRVDLNEYVQSPGVRARVLGEISDHKDVRPVHGLINNAAVQILGRIEALTTEDWTKTLNVNLLAPFLLVQQLLPWIAESSGSVVNISSIHATLTKSEFVAYATSKSALVGLTRSMAVELGGRVRVNAICPAAIDTSMLRAGFEGREREFRQLEQAHPVGSLGTPEDVAKVAVFLVTSDSPFLSGGIYSVDGAIGSRLHDPV